MHIITILCNSVYSILTIKYDHAPLCVCVGVGVDGLMILQLAANKPNYQLNGAFQLDFNGQV